MGTTGGRELSWIIKGNGRVKGNNNDPNKSSDNLQSDAVNTNIKKA